MFSSPFVCVTMRVSVAILENAGMDTRIRTTETYTAGTYGKDGQLNTDILECVRVCLSVSTSTPNVHINTYRTY
jgi:hypothetical protein